MSHPAQVPLFAVDPSVERFDLPEADVVLHRRVWTPEEADELATALTDTVPWEARQVTIAGQRVPIPRLSAWFGDPGATYVYSGIRHEPVAWSTPLREVRAVVERVAHASFNSCLANLYRDGSDSVAWHADDEPELGSEPLIASVSFGAERTFSMRHRDEPDATLRLALPAGSVLVMSGPTQRHWLHCVRKTRRPIGPRINLTFRTIV